MGRIVNHLSRNIGERFGGTDNERAAARFIESEMKSIGLETEVQIFKFLGYKLTREPSLRIHSPETVEMKPGTLLYSDSTAPDGFTGELKRYGTAYVIEGMFEWPKYSIVDDTGKIGAYIVAFDKGAAINIPLSRMGRFWGQAPHIMVGKKEYEMIEGWLNKNERVKVTVDVAGEYAPNVMSQNVIGALKGKNVPEEEVVVCAHYDSALGAVGADDNASGVEAMLRVAEKVVNRGSRKTVKFIAFGAEEYSLIGSNYYVEMLKERGQLNRVKTAINLDMVGAGDTLQIGAHPPLFEKQVLAAIEKSGLSKLVKVQTAKLCESSDHWPFMREAIPVTNFLFWPYEYYHQTVDTQEKVDDNTIDYTARAALGILKETAHLL